MQNNKRPKGRNDGKKERKKKERRKQEKRGATEERAVVKKEGKGRKEGRKEGRKAERKAGRQEGKAEVRKEVVAAIFGGGNLMRVLSEVFLETGKWSGRFEAVSPQLPFDTFYLPWLATVIQGQGEHPYGTN